MDKSEIKVGRHYAFREKRQPGVPFQQIRILEHIRGRKWKAEWIDPNQGLVDYIDSKQLVVAWKDRKAFLKDEEAKQHLIAHAKKNSAYNDTPVANALSEVFSSTGEGLTFWRGSVDGDPEAISRIKARCHFDHSRESPLSYVGRDGEAHIAFEEAYEIARAFCAAEPSTVLSQIEMAEREWSQETHQPGKEHIGSLLNEYRASWALVRQWAGMDKAVAERESQVQRLERLVWDAIYALQQAGLDNDASRLRKALKR